MRRSYPSQLLALSALIILSLYLFTYFYNCEDCHARFLKHFTQRGPSLQDLRLLSEKPANLKEYSAREQLISRLNDNLPVSVHISNPRWWQTVFMPVTSGLAIDNCPVPCEFSLNEERGFTEEQALTKDGIMVVDEALFPESKPINATTGQPIFQRWALLAQEPRVNHPHIYDPNWLRSSRVDILMNYHEDISQVMASYVENPEAITNISNIFNIEEFIAFNKENEDQRRPLISWFSSNVTPFRELWGLGLLRILSKDFAYLTQSHYKALSNVVMPEPCAALNHMDMRTCATAYYPFTLAIENSFEEDYASEKLWSAFEKGIVPVIAGAPNTRSFIPEGSAIFIEDFKSPDELAEYLKEVSQDVEEYERFHAWRKWPQEQWPDGFRYRIKMSRANLHCNLCVELARQRYLERPEIVKALEDARPQSRADATVQLKDASTDTEAKIKR